MTGKRGMEADCCAKNGRITRSNRCDGNQSGNSYEVDCASHVVGQGGEAELPADIAEPARQERALAHPLLDRTEGMLDRLPATIITSGRAARRFAMRSIVASFSKRVMLR